METYYSSDLHFNHKNIIKYSNRPFVDVSHMNRELIQRHNEIVTKEDIWVCNGDFGFKSGSDLAQILSEMNGAYKILVHGNHDPSIQFCIALGFNEVVKEYMTPEDIIITHYPQPEDPKPRIHGHTHSNLINEFPNHYNVAVEAHDYKPVNYKEILRNLLL